jgi:TRAP transporter TAXI family solute receptor
MEGTMKTLTMKLHFAAIAVMASAAFTSASNAAETATIVGAGPGAAAYQWAGGLAENVNRLKLGLTITNRASKGFVANTRMVEVGGTDFALTNGIFVYSAQNGQKPFEEMKAKKIRGIGPVATSWFQMAVVKDSGIKTYMDLKGKRVNYAEKGSNTEFMTRTIFEQIGIDGDLQKEYMRWDQAATAMTDGNIAAFGIPNPIPSPSILQASASAPLRILSVPDKAIKFFTDSNPGYYKSIVPAGSYTGMENETFTTVAYSVFSTANENAPAEMVYQFAKATYDPANRDFLVSASKSLGIGLDAAKDTGFLDQMKSFGLALHPGAARYWKEVGLIK